MAVLGWWMEIWDWRRCCCRSILFSAVAVWSASRICLFIPCSSLCSWARRHFSWFSSSTVVFCLSRFRWEYRRLRALAFSMLSLKVTPSSNRELWTKHRWEREWFCHASWTCVLLMRLTFLARRVLRHRILGGQWTLKISRGLLFVSYRIRINPTFVAASRFSFVLLYPFIFWCREKLDIQHVLVVTVNNSRCSKSLRLSTFSLYRVLAHFLQSLAVGAVVLS